MKKKFLFYQTVCLMIAIRVMLIPGFGQQDRMEDSLKNRLRTMTDPAKKVRAVNDLAYYYQQIHKLDLAIVEAEKGLTYSRTHNLEKGKADAFNVLGLVAYNRSLNEAAVQWFDSATFYFSRIQDTSGIVAILNNQSQAYRNMGACTEAVEGLLQATRLVEARNRQKKLLHLKVNYAAALMYCYQHRSAIEAAQSALSLARKLELNQYEPFLYHTIGYSHKELKEYKTALEALEEGAFMMKQMGDEYNYSAFLGEMGSVHLALGDYDKAYALYREFYEMQGADDYTLNVDAANVQLGIVLSRMERYDEAIPYLEKGLISGAAHKEMTVLPQGYLELSRVYRAKGKHQQAYTYLDKARSLTDSLRDLKLEGRIQELDKKFKTEKISRELAQTQLEMAKKESRWKNLIIIISAITVSMLLFYFVVILIMKRRHAEAEKRQVELEYNILRAQMNPHFIFNALNSIQGFFSENQFVEGSEYLGTFGHLMRRVLDQSAQASISLEDELETLELYLQLEQVRLKNQLSFIFELEEDLNPSMIDIPPLILQPFVENAIWHGIVPKKTPGTIIIAIRLDGNSDRLICTIEDNGVGLTKKDGSDGHESRGLQITRERLGKKGNVWIENRVSEDGEIEGVTAVVEIPLEDD